MDFKVSLIQSNIDIGNIKENFKNMKNKLHKVVEYNSDLVVLPETWLTGFSNEIFENIDDYSLKENNEIFQYLIDFAVDNDLFILSGSFLEKNRDNNIYNNLYLIDNKGNTKAKYSKTHLFSPGGENKVVTPGHNISTADTKFGKFGFMICYDIRFPELARLYGLEDIDVLYVVANFNEPKKDQWLNQLQARALENQFFVVACNRSGKNYFGNSVIVSPEGEILLNAGRREGIYSGFIDLKLIEEVKTKLPLMNDRREDLYNLEIREV
jgi:predicted amidohydrolase